MIRYSEAAIERAVQVAFLRARETPPQRERRLERERLDRLAQLAREQQRQRLEQRARYERAAIEERAERFMMSPPAPIRRKRIGRKADPRRRGS